MLIINVKSLFNGYKLRGNDQKVYKGLHGSGSILDSLSTNSFSNEKLTTFSSRTRDSRAPCSRLHSQRDRRTTLHLARNCGDPQAKPSLKT